MKNWIRRGLESTAADVANANAAKIELGTNNEIFTSHKADNKNPAIIVELSAIA